MRLSFLFFPSCSCSAVVRWGERSRTKRSADLNCGERSRTEAVIGSNYSIPTSLLAYLAIDSFSQQKTVFGSTCKSNEL